MSWRSAFLPPERNTIWQNEHARIWINGCDRAGGVRAESFALGSENVPRAVQAVAQPPRLPLALRPLQRPGDGGGSIRIPASCCGLFGFKAFPGKKPARSGWRRMARCALVEHILSRSVRDSAAMLDATHGNDVHAPFVIKPPDRKLPGFTRARDPQTAKDCVSIWRIAGWAERIARM